MQSTKNNKKAFISDQCKEIEENNRKGRLEISRKLGYQGNISCKDDHNKGQKLYRPNRSRSFKKRCQEYTELYKKNLHDPDNQDGVITHLELDILECEVKWALGSITTIKASGGDGIELFQLIYFKS